jgi:serine/threonine protein kinase/tetratricopeptide (TPR) repeat protein
VSPGERFGTYEVVDPLSSGGMGVVWRARDGDTEVALKTVLAVDAAMLRGIRAEIRALERVRHPAVVRILGHGVRDGLPWYAMELLRGATLRAHLERLFPDNRSATSTFPEDLGEADAPAPESPVPVPAAMGQLPQVLGWFRALAEGLAWLHGEGVVHRDLKPENVFVRPDGSPVLVDFGMAHAVVGAGTSRESLEALAQAGGTVDYMAPEQALGDVVDARADLYALGVMLFEALAGRPPFTGSRSTVLFAKLAQRAPSIDRFATGVPRPLGRLLEELLHPNPAARTAHARVVAGVLAALGAPAPTPGPQSPRPYVYRSVFQPPGTLSSTLVTLAGAADPHRGARLYVRGAAGSGRTRLLVEVAQTLRQSGFQSLTCPCVPAPGQATAEPLDPLRPLLRALVDRALQDGDPGDDALLAVHGPLLARWEPSLWDLPSVQRGGEVAELRPDTERVRLFTALAACVRRHAERGRTLLVVDDFEFADELTLGFLEALQEDDLANVALLVAGASPAFRGATPFELPPLSEEQVRTMLAAMCGATDAPPALVEHVRARAAGNPFVVAELLREAVRVGLLDLDAAGAWVLRDGDLGTLQVPGTVEALVDLRLAQVPPHAAAALRWAAVVGNGSEERLLAQGADADAIDALVRADVLGFDARGRLRFTSPTLAQVVHDRLPPAERRALHAAAATALRPARPGWHQRLARHLREAGDPEAFEASLLAGEEALAEIAFHQAVDELRHAVALVPPAASDAVRVRLHLRLGRAWWGAGQAARSHDALEAALVSAGEPRPDGSVRAVLRLLWDLGRELVRLARPDRTPEPPPAQSELHSQLAEAHRYLVYLDILRNEPLGMVSSALRASAHGAAGGRRARRAADLATLGVIAGFAGVRPLSDRFLARAEARLARSRERHDEVLVSLANASLALGNGRWDALHGHLDRGVAAALAVGDAEQHAVLGQLRGTALQLSGQVEACADQCARVLAESRAQMPRLWARCVLVDALVSLGRTEQAWSELRTVSTELGAHGEDLATRSNVLALQATLELDGGRFDEATRTLTQADALCRQGSEEAFGVFPFHCHAPRGWLHLRAARPDDRAVVAAAERSVEGARRYAARFPIGRPPALRHLGVLRALEGRADAAHAAFTQAREAAHALGMVEHAAATDAEALRLLSGPELEAARRDVAERLTALGCHGTLRRSPARGSP